jgi:cysteine synthase A
MASIDRIALANSAESQLESLSHLIGNTPLLAVDYELGQEPRTVYMKCEYMNFTGSIKDRVALNILREGYQTGLLRPGDTIVEATSGNTGISLSAIGRAMGHPVMIFMPDWMSAERASLIRSFGAEIVPVTREQGGFLRSIALCEEMSAGRKDVFLANQFANAANTRAHRQSTGPEILRQLASLDLVPDAFVAGVGTGGTIVGTGQYLKEKEPDVKLYAVEPEESPTLSTGTKTGSHRIQGISDDFIPSIIDFNLIDEVLAISDGDSIIMAQRLASELGLGVGISSGCNFLAAVKIQNQLGGRAIVATIACDDNKKYLSTTLLGDEPVRDHYLSPRVVLKGIRSVCRSNQR